MILIGIGVILLLNNLGYLDWNFWDILNLWPILLVAAGLELLVGRRSLLGSLFSAIIVLGLIVGGVWFVSTSDIGRTTAQSIEIREPRGDITAARVTLAPAVAQLNVKALDDSGNFVEGTAFHRSGERLTPSFTRGDTARLSLKTSGSATMGVGRRNVWNFSFHPDVKLDLDIDTGMGDVNLDLRMLTLESVKVNAGMGTVTIKLPETGTFDVDIDSGMGTVVIEVPAGLGVRLQTQTAIVGRNLPAGYTQDNNRYTSPNYDSAEHRANIQVDLGMGSITIREVGN